MEEVRQLEKSYRTVMLFYKNTDSDKIKNISIVNASMSQLTDLDNSFFIDAIANELRANYDRLDLRTNYSLLVIPGYLGSNKVVEKWAKIAHDNKVMIYTLIWKNRMMSLKCSLIPIFREAMCTNPTYV